MTRNGSGAADRAARASLGAIAEYGQPAAEGRCRPAQVRSTRGTGRGAQAAPNTRQVDAAAVEQLVARQRARAGCPVWAGETATPARGRRQAVADDVGR